VGNNATVGTTCNNCSGKVVGTVTTGNVQPAPPTTTFPEVNWDEQAWIDEGWTVANRTCTSAADGTTLANLIKDPSTTFSDKTVIHITGGCSLTITNNSTITRSNDLAIFTDGEIITQNLTTWTSSSSDWHDLYLIVGTGSSCAGTDGRITMSNQTAFTRLYFFVYSPCQSTFAQNNSTARGQIYGQVVAASNALTFTFHAMLVPGSGSITGYEGNVVFKREVD
jgi:hypothetical protein